MTYKLATFQALNNYVLYMCAFKDLLNFTSTEAKEAEQEIERLEDSKLLSRVSMGFRPSELAVGMSFSSPPVRTSNPMFNESAINQLQTPLVARSPIPEQITDAAI